MVHHEAVIFAFSFAQKKIVDDVMDRKKLREEKEKSRKQKQKEREEANPEDYEPENADTEW